MAFQMDETLYLNPAVTYKERRTSGAYRKLAILSQVCQAEPVAPR